MSERRRMRRFLVRRAGNFWQVTIEGERNVFASADTQQYAIEIAKVAAREERGQVEWCDRDGFRQGEVDYSTPGSRRLKDSQP